MKLQGTLLLHGYGVRGDIWRLLQAALSDKVSPVEAPDLSGGDIQELVTLAKGRIRRMSLEQDGPILVIGHSLGAVLTAVSAHDLGPEVVAGAVMIAPPFGERDSVPSPFLRFLLRHRLLPPALIRPRFFSSATPKKEQKMIFRNATPEAPALQQITFERKWFHVDVLTSHLKMPSLVITSEADRIVPSAQSQQIAEVLGSRLSVYPEQDGIAHDDLFAAPAVVDRISERVEQFVQSEQ